MTKVTLGALAAISLVIGAGCVATSEPTNVATCKTPPSNESLGDWAARCSGRPTTPPEWTVSPDSERGKDYLRRLRAVHPELGHERTLGWGKSMCRDFMDGDAVPPRDERAALERVKRRYAGGTRPPLTDAQANMILAAVTTDICPEYAPE